MSQIFKTKITSTADSTAENSTAVGVQQRHCVVGESSYPPGFRWVEGDCKSCVCLDGQVECFERQCAELKCIDGRPLRVKNSCCPVCASKADLSNDICAVMAFYQLQLGTTASCAATTSRFSARASGGRTARAGIAPAPRRGRCSAPSANVLHAERMPRSL